MKHFLSLLTLILLAMLASYSQQVESTEDSSNFYAIEQEDNGTLDFATKSYYSVDFQCAGTGTGQIRRQGSFFYNYNLCGESDNIQEGYYATYEFIPGSGSRLSHLFVNSVDMINNLSSYENGSGISYSWTLSNASQNYTVRAVFDQAQIYTVDFLCAGTGTGQIRRDDSYYYYYYNLCGESDNVQEGYYATYEFIPGSGSRLSHLYVNSVDMINSLSSYENGSGISYSWTISNASQNYTVRAVFDQAQIYTVDFLCAGTGTGQIRRDDSYYYYYNLCGESDNVQEGYYATYAFIPGSGSRLSHLYVNSVDMINSLSSYENGSGISYSWTISNASQNYTVRAVFNSICYGYEVEVLSNDISMGTTEGSGCYDYGTYAEIRAIPAYNYRFVRWNDGNTENPRTIYINRNDIYIAYFDEGVAEYNITVESSDESMGSTYGSGMYQQGSVAYIGAIPNDGYRFVSWRDGSIENPRAITVTTDATYIAEFEAIPLYTITVLSNNSRYGSVTGGGSFYEGTNVIIEAMPFEGCVFTSWDDGNTENPRAITVTADATYIAQFEAIPLYTITVLSSNSRYGSVTGGGTFYEGTNVIIEAIPFEGYVFTSWDDGNTENPRTITITGDATYIANFTEISSVTTYTITVLSANETYGTVTGGGIFAEGTIITITAIPNSGFEFHQWNDNNTENPRQFVVEGNAVYIATFIEITSDNSLIDIYEEPSVYPNPTSDILYIKSFRQMSHVEIFTMTGQIVLDIDADSDSVVCNVENFVQGVYFVRIYYADGKICPQKQLRFVKE